MRQKWCVILLIKKQLLRPPRLDGYYFNIGFNLLKHFCCSRLVFDYVFLDGLIEDVNNFHRRPIPFIQTENVGSIPFSFLVSLPLSPS